jgi:hypothetical protein
MREDVMLKFPVFNQHVSHGVRLSLCEGELEERFARQLERHRLGDAGELGDEQTRINRAIIQRWHLRGRQHVDDTIRSEFVLEQGLTIVILTCRHFTTIYAKDEYHDWSPEDLLASLA